MNVNVTDSEQIANYQYMQHVIHVRLQKALYDQARKREKFKIMNLRRGKDER